MTALVRPEKTARLTLEDEWYARAPRDPEAIAAFYRDNTTLADDLLEWHSLPWRQERTQALVQFAREHGVQSVLDVGCGMGQDILALRRAGIRSLTAVEPHDEMRERVAAYGIPCFDSLERQGTEFDFPQTTYDLVLCIDVLEHLLDPDAFLDALMALVAPGGHLAEVTATEDVGDPLHLKRNWGWKPDHRLLRAGFVRVATHGSLTFWQQTDTLPLTQQSLLLMVYRDLTAQTFSALTPLIASGKWWLLTLSGDGLISRVRSRAVSEWWRKSPDDVFMILDDDVTFDLKDAERVCQRARETRGIACGGYIKGDLKGPALRFFPHTTVVMGRPGDPPVEVEYAATGFMAVHRDVIAKLIPTLPVCSPQDEGGFWPFFQPFVKDHDYLSEDYAFCQRALELGFTIDLLPDIRLGPMKLFSADLTMMARQLGNPEPESAAIAFHVDERPRTLLDGDDPNRAEARR